MTAGEIFEEFFCVGRNFLFLRQIVHLCRFLQQIYVLTYDSGVARGRAIGQLPNDSKVIAQRFFKIILNCPIQKKLDIRVVEDLNDVILIQ